MGGVLPPYCDDNSFWRAQHEPVEPEENGLQRKNVVLQETLWPTSNSGFAAHVWPFESGETGGVGHSPSNSRTEEAQSAGDSFEFGCAQTVLVLGVIDK